jgi:hypothetical protein
MSIETAKSDDKIARKFGLHFEKIAIVRDSFDYLDDVVGAFHVLWHNAF